MTAAGLIARHSLDFWLTSEDLPDPDNRVTLDRDGNIVLSYTPNNGAGDKRLIRKLEGLLQHPDMHPHLVPRNLFVGNRIPLAGVAHQNGTIRFGRDPKSSALDVNCKDDHRERAARRRSPARAPWRTHGRDPRSSGMRRHRVLALVAAAAVLAVSDTQIAGREFELLEGLFGARARVVRLRLGDETIELTEYLAPKGRPMPADVRPNDRVFQHAAIILSDMAAAYQRLKQFKVEHASTRPNSPPRHSPCRSAALQGCPASVGQA